PGGTATGQDGHMASHAVNPDAVAHDLLQVLDRTSA
ncbi:MAG: hypothetical protein JWR64_1391, partial [Marmoricola sp.]|nr:hypothetical protein [Marmoricola sp.]